MTIPPQTAVGPWPELCRRSQRGSPAFQKSAHFSSPRDSNVHLVPLSVQALKRLPTFQVVSKSDMSDVYLTRSVYFGDFANQATEA